MTVAPLPYDMWICERGHVSITKVGAAGAAVRKVVAWMEAHYAEFHPEDRRPFDMRSNIAADRHE